MSAPNSTITRPTPPSDQPRRRPPRLQLSLSQLIASALAAVSATIAASYLGVSGTVIGAAVASVVSVLGNALYGHSLQRTGARVRASVPATRLRAIRTDHGWETAPAVTDPESQPVGPPRRRFTVPARVVVAACVGTFVGLLLIVTVVELAAGKPLTDLLRGRAGSGTSVTGVLGEPTQRTAVHPAPSPVTITVTPRVVTQTPTIVVTAPPTIRTMTPSTSPTAVSTSPTASPSAPAGTDTGSTAGP